MFSDLYEDLANSFNDWVESSPTGGDYVTNITIDYANRAQDGLWSEAPTGWSMLVRSAELTLSGLTATLPAGCGKLIHVYSDIDEDGKPDCFYFKDGRLVDGFKFIPAFTKAAGHSTTIQFFLAPPEPIYCDYQVKLDAFTGTGTEYLFFPKNLMLGKMQYLRCLDAGMLNEWKAISTEYNRELEHFKSQHQNQVENPGIVAKDYYGKELYLPEYNLDSGMRTGGKVTGSENDRDSYR